MSKNLRACIFLAITIGKWGFGSQRQPSGKEEQVHVEVRQAEAVRLKGWRCGTSSILCRRVKMGTFLGLIYCNYEEREGTSN
jgi:hypothetical protein